MTRKEQVQVAWIIARDQGVTLKDRLDAINKMLRLKKEARVSFSKLDVDEAEFEALQAALLADAALETEDEKPAAPIVAQVAAQLKKPKPAKKAKKPTDPNRGKITELCRELLLADDAPYAVIVATVLKKYPEARTTARSVASIASDMRKAGKKVAMRRKSA